MNKNLQTSLSELQIFCVLREGLSSIFYNSSVVNCKSAIDKASTKFYISEAQDPSPETGDTTNIALWEALTAVSFAVLIACIEELKKKKRA